jgi:hypothetical protein
MSELQKIYRNGKPATMYSFERLVEDGIEKFKFASVEHRLRKLLKPHYSGRLTLLQYAADVELMDLRHNQPHRAFFMLSEEVSYYARKPEVSLRSWAGQQVAQMAIGSLIDGTLTSDINAQEYCEDFRKESLTIIQAHGADAA